MADKITFLTNQAQEVRLAFLEGRPVEGRFGDQYLFSTVDDRCFYVSTTVGQILEKQLLNLRIKAGEPVEIGKWEMDLGRGRKGIQWICKRVEPEAGVCAPAPVREATQQTSQVLNGVNSNGSKPPAIATGWAQFLLEQTTTLIDVYAAALQYSSTTHGNAIKPDDVRSMMTTVLINMSKNGGQRAA
jgi:hypothetical protein